MIEKINKSQNKSKKKICIILTEFFTFDYYISRLTEECLSKEFVILGKFSRKQIIERNDKFKNVVFINIDINRKNIGLNNLKTIFNIYKILKSEKFFKVITIMPKANFLGQIAAKLASVKDRNVILTGPIWYDKRNLKRIFLKLTEFLFISLSTKVIADSKSQGKFLKSIYPEFLHYKISSVNSISSGQYKFDLKRNFSKNIENSLRVGHFGRLSIRKGTSDVIKIAKEFLRFSNTSIFLIAGPVEDEKLNDEIYDIVKQYSKNIIFKNGFFDMYEMLNQVDILLMPSKYEGFGITAIEASKSGVIVLGYDVLGLKDAIINNITGVKVPYGNFDKIIKLLSYYESNRIELKDFQLRSYNYSHKKFTKEKVLGSLKKELDL